ncbi:hypothetical protein STVIR_2307 [Streptomyces viridochromogenes Tue57]|uniref:Uncharacterized protein n=1 Tax=Streptomyces viridochromogenes Tue57 TaxID=1160705 RepID=L8PGP9_STRVR|nr:hypothetical protein STVIR_2307 [Streptomyces viridochromogenes Tue57]
MSSAAREEHTGGTSMRHAHRTVLSDHRITGLSPEAR